MVPEGWHTKQVSDVCHLKNGHGFKPEEWDTQGLPIIRIQNLNGSQNFNYFSGEPEQDWLVPSGQMLFAWAGTKGVSFGPTIWKGKTGVLNQHIFKVFAKKSIDEDWLYYCLQHVTHRIERRAHGFKATLVHVKKSEIDNQLVLVPSFEEQKRIAQVLLTWDRAIETIEKLIENSECQKKSLMQKLLSPSERLSEFSDPWAEVHVADMGTVVGGGTPDSDEPTYWGGDILWATPTDVTALKSRYIFSTSKNISKLGLKNSAARLLPKGALLMCTRATIGDLAIAEEPIATNQGFKSLIPNKRYDVDFLYYLFTYNKHVFKRNACGSTFVELSKHDFEKQRLLVPSLAEQKSIASVLNSASAEIETLKIQLGLLNQEKSALMQQLLTGERRVQVDAAVGQLMKGATASG